MKNRMKNKLPLAAAVALMVGATSSYAATIFADDFTGVVTPVDSNEATITAWNTLNGVTATTTFNAFTHTGAQSFYEDATDNILDVDATTNGTGQGWDVLFDVTLAAGTQSIALNTFDLTSLVTNGSGVARNLTSPSSQWDWTVAITGDGLYGTQSVTDTMTITAGNAPRNGALSLDLSTLGDLVSGENYTFSVGVRFTGTGDQAFMALDSVSLDGIITPIPEPSAALLGGIGALMLLRRRRN